MTVNYRGFVTEETDEFCTVEMHREGLDLDDKTCDLCGSELDASSPTLCKMTQAEYARLGAERRVRLQMIESLSRRWSEIHHKIEQDGFRRMADEEDGNYGPEFDSDEEQAEYEARQKVQDQMEALELQTIEDKLDALNARMMRPYERWNESEVLMRMMEGE
jgi:predicted nuclease with TOPRIM domain